MQTHSFHTQTPLFQGFPLPKRKHKEELWVSTRTEVPVFGAESSSAFEFENLGNVTDRKFGVPVSGTDPTISYYLADIVSATDYDPYGQALPGRVWNRTGYRFGFNGQEFDSELGEVWSAEFWEYDASLGRRWDIDPIDLPWQSPYVAFDCNPIAFSDPLGLMSAPTGDGDGPKTAQKISKKASYTASRASMEQGFKNNKGQYALNIVTSKSNNFNQIHKPNINLVINFTNDKLFDDDSEEILGKASVFYHVESEWKNQSELKESDLNKINIDTRVEIRVTVTTNIDDEDEDPLIEIIATLFHELYIHAAPFSEIAELIKQGGEGQTTKPNTSSVEEIYDPIDRKTLYDYFMMDYIDPNDLDKGSLKNRLKDKNSKGTNSLYVNNQHLGLIQWYFYTKAKSNKPILTIRSAQILNEALINFKDVHPLLYKKVETALLKDAKTHLLIGINKQLKLCGLTY